MKKFVVAMLTAATFVTANVAEAQITGTLRLENAPRLATEVVGYQGQGGGFAGTFTVGPVVLLNFDTFLMWCVDSERTVNFNTDYTYTLYNRGQFLAADPFAWGGTGSARYNRIADGVAAMIAAPGGAALNAARNDGQKESWDAFSTGGGTGDATFNSNDYFILVANNATGGVPGITQTFMFDRSPFTVPEPGTFALLAIGGMGFGIVARRRNRSA